MLKSLCSSAEHALQDPRAEPNWSLSIRRSQVLHALESCLAVLSGAEDAYLAWRQASAQTEAQLHRLLASGRQHSAALDQVQNVVSKHQIYALRDQAAWQLQLLCNALSASLVVTADESGTTAALLTQTYGCLMR